jgi:hypothetical protein
LVYLDLISASRYNARILLVFAIWGHIVVNQANLSSEERIRRAVRAAKLERSPAYTAILRKISPAVKLANANSLFVMARDALYHQEIRRGHPPEEAMHIAAQRMLSLHAR